MNMDFHIIKLQLAILSRPHARLKESFLDKLIENIKIPNFNNKFENILIAFSIKAMGSPLEKRQELCMRMIDAIDCIDAAKKDLADASR